MGTLTDSLNDIASWLGKPLFDPDERTQYLLEQHTDLSALEDRRNDCLANPEACTLTGNEYVNEKNRLETNISFHEDYINNWDIYGGLIESAVLGAAGGLIGIASKGLPSAANYAQKTYNKFFSEKGAEIYSDLAGYAVKTIDDLANAIRRGDVDVNDIPVEVVVRDGQTLILNTRTAKALEAAGVDRNDINVIDVTGDELKETLLDGQLTRNKLTNSGITDTRPSFEECFGAETPIDMWPLDHDLQPGPDGIYDQDEVRSKVWKKPIAMIQVGDLVVSFDDNDNLVPGPVTQTFENDVKILLDFHGTRVTPGHVYYRADSKKPYKYETLIDILRDDGVIKHQDGTLIRAAINVPVGDPRDGFVKASTGARQADGTMNEKDQGRIRLGTRFIVSEGKKRKSWAVADLIEHAGGVVGDDEMIRVGDGPPMAFHWEFGDTLPKPEDFVLEASGTTLEDIYKAAEWESQGPRLPTPMVLDRGPVQPLSHTALNAMPRNEPLDVAHAPMAAQRPQRVLNRKQRKAMEAKQRKTAKVRKQLIG